jgi:hypothetical protein
MNSDSPDRFHSITATQVAVFSALREKLASEVSSSALLAELLERVTLMQKARATPEEFKKQFYEFVSRAEEQLEAVEPLLPALLAFLPCHPEGGAGERANRFGKGKRSGDTAGIL